MQSIGSSSFGGLSMCTGYTCTGGWDWDTPLTIKKLDARTKQKPSKAELDRLINEYRKRLQARVWRRLHPKKRKRRRRDASRKNRRNHRR